MTWFNRPVTIDKSALTLIHITDSHIFETPNGEYFSVNTAKNLVRTLEMIAKIECDAVIFGGDLTQDHTLGSYQLFAKLVQQSGLADKFYWLPGNHDEIKIYHDVFSQYGISSCKRIECYDWQVLLLDSKGDTPAGWVSSSHLQAVSDEVDKHKKFTTVFSHHHPLPIQGYLDKHILENGPELISTLVQTDQVKALFHGHVHNEYSWHLPQLDVFATPATSIQFEKYTQDWQQTDLGPAFRIIRLNSNGSINTQVIWLDNV